MAIAQSLLREIDIKQKKIMNTPELLLCLKHRRFSAENITNLQSWWLEHPDNRAALFSGKKDVLAESYKRAREGLHRIDSAWSYLQSAGYPFDFDTFKEIGKRVDAKNDPNPLRSGHVSLGLDYVPPNVLKVPDLLLVSLGEMQRTDLPSIERAIGAHLHIAAIQPFNDGNKRAARLYQNVILTQHGLPLVTVYSGERTIYLDLLERGMNGYRSKDVKLQRDFYDFIGCKLNVELDHIISDTFVKHPILFKRSH